MHLPPSPWNRAPQVDPELDATWQRAAQALLEALSDPPRRFHDVKEQFLVLVTFRDEKQQVQLLQRFAAEGLECKALVS